MATLTDGGFPTLAQVLKRLKPDGSIESNMADTLTKDLPILEDIPWIEGNLPTGHRITGVNVLPTPTWRMLNQGVAATRGETIQYDETCGMLEAVSKVDVDLAKLNGNEVAFRASEDKLIVESMGQELARAFFYESVATNPEKIHGLTPRYGATTGYTASANVINHTTSGVDGQSVWLINWSPDHVFGIYPKGSIAGLQHKDKGEIYVNDQQTTPQQMLAYVSHYQWKAGLAIKDWRYACRMQWDPDTTNFTVAGKGLYLALLEMISTVRHVGPNARFYMNRTSYSMLTQQLVSNTTNFLEYLEHGGKRLPHFMGVPIRLTDTLVAETVVV